MKISEKKAAFVHLLLEGYTELDAYRGAYKNDYSDTKARHFVRKLLNDETVQAYMHSVIEEREGAVKVDSEFVIKHLKRIVLEKPNSNMAVRSLELLGKYLAMWVEKQVIEDNTDHKAMADEVWQRRLAREKGEEIPLAMFEEVEEKSEKVANVLDFVIKEDGEDEERRHTGS